jgi:hypothetical protein
MARKIELEVEVNGIGAVEQNLQSLQESLDQMKTQLKGVSQGSAEFNQLTQSIAQTEAELQKLSGATNTADSSLGNLSNSTAEATQEQMSLNAQIGEAEDKLMLMAQAGDTSSAAYKQLLIETGKMKRVQMETNVQIDNAAKGFGGRMTLGVQRAAAALQVGMSAMAMFGVENEKAAKVMAQLQAVMAFTSGIEQLKQLTVGMKLFGQGGVGAMSAIKKGIIATGIGALVVAVGTLVAYWDDIVGFISGGVSEQQKLVDAGKKNVGVAEQALTAFDNQVNSLKLQGKTDKEILQLRIKKIDAVIKEQEAYVAAMEQKQEMEVAASKRNQEITEMIIRGAIELSTVTLRLLVAPIDLVLETANDVSEALGFGKITTINLNDEITKMNKSLAKTASTFLFDPDKVKADGDKLIQEEKNKLDKLKSDRDGFQLEIKRMEQEALNERLQKGKESAEKAAEREKERQEKLKELRGQELDLIKEINNRKLEADNKLLDATLAAMEDGVEKQTKILEKAYLDERQTFIDKANEREVEALDKKFVEGLIKEAEYLESLKKLREDDSRLTDEERALLIQKEKAKNNEINKITEDDNEKKKKALEGYNAWRRGKEEDEKLKRINSVNDEFKTESEKLEQFLKDKVITQEEYDKVLVELREKRRKDLEKIDDDEKLVEKQKTIAALRNLSSIFESVKGETTAFLGSLGSTITGGIATFMDLANKSFESTTEKVAAYAQAVAGVITQVLGAVGEEQRRRTENQLENIQETYDTESKLLEEQKAKGLLTEDQFAQMKYKLDVDKFKKEEEIKKKAFENDKKMKIAQAITSGLQGAVAAFASAMTIPPPAGQIIGGIMAGIVAAMTAVNVAQIAATKYEGGSAPTAPSIPGGGDISGALTQAPSPSTTTLFGAPMTEGNEGGSQATPGQRQVPMRAYVLESDISTSQNTISNYEQRAEIG